MSFGPRAKFDRFVSPRDEWDDGDGCDCSRSIVASVLVACSPVALKYYLDHKAEQRRIEHAKDNPELYGIDSEEEDE